ncbi:MAG: hypothetical protein Q8L72_05285 [Moraxellaceae bacterium]|nr:hypothetical protein [Moraxellaceae bacterium]
MRKFCVVALLACATSVHASSFGVIPQAGLAGYGATVQWGFTPYLAVTAGYTGGDFSVRNVETDDATYDGDIRLRNPQVLLNWAPFGGHFRLSGGLVASNSGFDLVATDIQNQPAVERADVSASFANDLAPILTLGFESPLQQKGFGYHLSAGVVFAGKPEANVSVTCRGPVNQAACDQFTASERKEIEDELSKYQFLPVLQAGLIFRM